MRRDSLPSEGHRAIQAEEQGTEVKGGMMGEVSGWLNCWSHSGMTGEKYAGLSRGGEQWDHDLRVMGSNEGL